LARRRDERAVDRLEGACVCRVCVDVVGGCEGAVVAESGAVRGGVRPLAVLRCVLR
jgi:outer membrane lipoprotein SlyB